MHRKKAGILVRQLRNTQNAAFAFRRASEELNIKRANEQDPILSGDPHHHDGDYEMKQPLIDQTNIASLSNCKNGFYCDLKYVYQMIVSNPLNILLVLSPFAVWSYYGNWGDRSVFILNFLVLIPIANILGEATEVLALHTGETIGGLVNATFGNAVEVVVAILALKHGEFHVVQSSLVGSVLSNLLMVLGCCFIAGSFVSKENSFNVVGATANSSLLMLSTFGMLLPSYVEYSNHIRSSSLRLSHEILQKREDEILTVSRISAIFLFLMYLQLLYFQLGTHIHLFQEEKKESDENNNEKEEDDKISQDHHELSMQISIVLLLISTLLVSIFSEYMVSSIDGFAHQMHLSKSFVGIILLPIVGNAVEHFTAVKVALNGKMELSMGVAVGSSTQVSLFIVPVVVMAGWLMDQPMTLAFPMFHVIVLMLSIIIVYAMVADGKSNWLEGSMLLTAYALVAVSLLYIQ